MYTSCDNYWGNFERYIEECEKMIEKAENLAGEKRERFKDLIQGEGDRKIANAIGKIEEKIKNLLEREKKETKCKYKYFRIK